jgi:hypothetical protein
VLSLGAGSNLLADPGLCYYAGLGVKLVDPGGTGYYWKTVS